MSDPPALSPSDETLLVPLASAPWFRVGAVDYFAPAPRCPDPACRGVGRLVGRDRRERRIYACSACGRQAERPTKHPCVSCGAELTTVNGHFGCAPCAATKSRPTVPEYPPSAWEAALSTGHRARSPEYLEACGVAAPQTWAAYPRDFAGRRASKLYQRFGLDLDADGEEVTRENDHDERFVRHVNGTDDEVLAEGQFFRRQRLATLERTIWLIADHGKAIPEVPKRAPRGYYKPLCRAVLAAYKQALLELSADVLDAIIARGGSFAGLTEGVRVRVERTTPFAGYRAALRASLGMQHPEAESPGRGAGSLGRSAATEYKHGLPSGMQFGNKMAVNPSKNGASAASTSRGTSADDAVTCLRAARVGGTWLRAKFADDGQILTPAVCYGGRPLTPLELRLLELGDLGAWAGAGLDLEWQKLKLSDALRRIQHAREGGAYVFPEARHLLAPAAKAMLAAARGAVIDAFEAWGLIPRPAPPAAKPPLPAPVELEL